MSEARFMVGPIPLVRRSVSILPGEGTPACVDNGDERFTGDRRAGARFEQGQWRKLDGAALSFDPTFWTVMDESRIRPNGGD